ncbi:MAG TPA: hypothetical protein VMV49_09325 [Candidatus Deferrimicrobium sp.]|nr:hypothetical protein [Candidatus Deferrimicrobium sp.]
MPSSELLNGKGNLTDTYIACLDEHRVFINGQPFYLIKTFYGTNTREDFFCTFSNELDTDLYKKAEIIPDTIAFNEYGVIYDLSLRVVAVFNMQFAYYDFQKRKVIFRGPEDILLDYYKESPKFTQKSLDDQLKEKLEACEEKVHDKIAAHSGPVARPTPVPVEPQVNVEARVTELEKRIAEKTKRRDFMEHAVMYAAAPPVEWQ